MNTVLCRTGLPGPHALPSPHSVTNHLARRDTGFPAQSTVSRPAFAGLTSPKLHQRARRITPGRIVFGILRTADPLPVALHPASRRRSYLRLPRSEHLLGRGLSPLRQRLLPGALGAGPRARPITPIPERPKGVSGVCRYRDDGQARGPAPTRVQRYWLPGQELGNEHPGAVQLPAAHVPTGSGYGSQVHSPFSRMQLQDRERRGRGQPTVLSVSQCQPLGGEG